ncbi:hypothetical protein AMS68_007501 [Peltaster fructicola]|uniref:Cep57 centrosome microtubule-binding domain-containing protein n=1 Tax=Peltaster fructicola TaxID=286661 RepID=A0A6H0Y4P5_9PEZI|nr:hypothetical protein AMS68_007501 [Peltaster fructicola]
MTRKREASMREVSLRRANEGAKRSMSQTAKTSANLSDVLRANKMVDNATESIEIVVNQKNTRFTHKKVIPVATTSGKTTTPAQSKRAIPLSTMDTGDFLLPDVSNLGDLIDPMPKDNTSRFASKGRSRFTPSATHRMPVRFEGTDRLPVRSIPIPEDEKKIYAALQTLQEKFNQLELDNAEAGKQLDQYERENADLRNAVAREEQYRRPDSAIDSEDETTQEKWRMDRTKMQSSLRSIQQRYDKIERKLKIRETDLRTCTKERDDLITQLGVECYRLQELEAENAQLRQDHDALQTEVSELRQEVHILRTPAQHSVKDITGTFGRRDNTRRSSRFSAPNKTAASEDTIAARSNCINFDIFDDQARQQIADVVKQQWQNQQGRRRSSSRQAGTRLHSTMFDIDSRPVKAAKTSASLRRQHKATIEDEDADEEVYTEFELTNTKNMTGRSLDAVDVNNDITELTANDPAEVQKLRQFLEEQRRSMLLKRHSSAPVVPQQTTAVPANRRSSLRDLTGNIASDTKRTVRVQSPAVQDRHLVVDDDTQTSLPSNVGRRRSSAAQDGETSAFIIPDITLHRKASLRNMDSNHDVQACTVCNQDDANITIPLVCPISTKTDLPEDATIRPSQPPRNALARVLKQLNDELTHLKFVLAGYQKQHNTNDPSIGARARKQLYDKISEIMAECKRKEDQIYALYDAAEGQINAYDEPKSVKQRISTPAAKKTFDVNTGTTPLPAFGLDGAYDVQSDEESVGLPAWEGLSELED